MKPFYLRVMISIAVISVFILNAQPLTPQVNAASPIPEGNDFATRVLGDPWDMSEKSDISQYLNSDDTQSNITNIQVSNGVFSATSVSDGQFFTLFPGYVGTLSVGKVGDRYPINSNVYKCLYFAMKTDSRAPEGNLGPDTLQVFWFSDKGPSYNALGSYTAQVGTYPKQFWNLFSVNLATASEGGLTWSSQANWKGLRIDPSQYTNENFAVDWVRLTDCAARSFDVTLPSTVSNTSIWARPAGTTRDIRVATGVSGNSGSKKTLDLQGMQPGIYEFFLGSDATTRSSTSLGSVEINQAPIVKISRPSFTSGASYGSQIGNPWDMSNTSDATTECTSSSFLNGMLVMDTVSAASQPGNCVGGTVADPKVFLNSPQLVNTADYRYMTFRMKTDGAWQKFGGGMMARFIWVSNECYLVSNDIPYDVDWNTLSIDLHDPYMGNAVQRVGARCLPGGQPMSWTSSSTAGSFRFDPNENVSGSPFHQELDWVSLNKVDQVKSGGQFPLGISTNKNAGQVSLTYYYTTSVANPKQHAATVVTATPGVPPVLTGPHFLYLPGIFKDYDPNLSGSELFWDTRGVAAGSYYICVDANDSLNNGIYCSEAPVNVTN